MGLNYKRHFISAKDQYLAFIYTKESSRSAIDFLFVDWKSSINLIINSHVSFCLLLSFFQLFLLIYENLKFVPLEPILVVVRLAENGCLLSHLKKSRENSYINVQAKNAVHFTPVDRIKIARDVACGMLHLASKVVNILFIVYASDYLTFVCSSGAVAF